MNRDDYYMQIAMAVRRKANCLGRRVGAVIVKANRIISTGYNGTPEGIVNCVDGGCYRCENRDAFKSGSGYDVCICVHAEQNALITAARFGHAIENSTVYSTLRPCFDCTKALLQAKVKAIRYIHEWGRHKDESLHKQYLVIQASIRYGVKRVTIADTDEDWANGKVKFPIWHPGHGKDEKPLENMETQRLLSESAAR